MAAIFTRLIKRRFGVHMTMHRMRHYVVTHASISGWSDGQLTVLAFSMGHTRSAQARFYYSVDMAHETAELARLQGLFGTRTGMLG